ncbi:MULTISPECIES: type I 3-dehydroquinate dehydratase [Lactococcus]|uniref:3-dehydroquinate dehydratase n=1 Tax=Lactococcus garvieae TaxID=1363 RepID=A0AA46TWS8_9LACT|nr:MULTISPECIES: type I 3-dehydroquinate dehydratase [Lactococcus]KXT62126.1 3-dehydroquinate dehydratase I [Lactococcus sp. DD01]MCI3871056.1 type I 3-dehydroquinate dehydratase [Lactococcus petauri]MCQ8275447.1 3-dehydroquinate dehydratase [Lactococcus petauri]MCR6588765.1 type I 3-dehydroquinate dehydratase [Lactococcus petauri]MCU7363568.1 type I 3-dehydroquinate dehydratase [Lactococcus petauri]
MRKTKIVVPVLPTTVAEVQELNVEKYRKADIIEWRADFLGDIESILQAAPFIFEKFKDFSLLFTVRTANEGGNISISKKDYVTLLKKVAKFDPDYIDIEYFSYRKALPQLLEFKEKIVLSYHNFFESPTDLTARMMKMQREETGFVKVAIMAQRECDVLDLLQITRDFTMEYGPKFIGIAMGELGKISRVAGGLTGSVWTFVALDKEEGSAPGQLTLPQMLDVLDALEA